MENNMKDMLYTISARLAQKEYDMRKDLNLKKRILKVFDYVKEYQNLLQDRKIIVFFKEAKNGKLTGKNLIDAEKIIKKYEEKNSNRIFAIIGRRECTIPFDTENDIREYCNELSLALDFNKESQKSIRTLIEKDGLGEEIFTLENIELFHSINLVDLEPEERNLLMALYKKWASEIDFEYQQLKQQQSEVKTMGPLLSIRDYKAGNYPRCYEDNLASEDISETTTYIRSLIKMGEENLAYSLIQNNKEAYIVRIIYEIECELALLDKEVANDSIEEDLINEMKQELIMEKEEINKMLEGGKVWKKLN